MQPNEESSGRSRGLQKTEDTGLATSVVETSEIATTKAAMEARAEIESAIIVAQRFPRDEDEAFRALMRSCQRERFAEGATYRFPRGGSQIEGPSVKLAREGARCWGNIRHGLVIVRDAEEDRHIQGWAWDMQTNVKITAEDTFAKLIQRKDRSTGATEWVVPDERDLRELTNRRGAILVRNCILQLLPSDLVDDAVDTSKSTVQKGAESDPEEERKKVIMAFSSLNITPKMLEGLLGHPIGQSSPVEIARLRAIFESVRDGNSTWAEHLEAQKTADETQSGSGAASVDDLKPGTSENPYKDEEEERLPGVAEDRQPVAGKPPVSFGTHLTGPQIAELRKLASGAEISWQQIEARFGGPLEQLEVEGKDAFALEQMVIDHIRQTASR